MLIDHVPVCSMRVPVCSMHVPVCSMHVPVCSMHVPGCIPECSMRGRVACQRWSMHACMCEHMVNSISIVVAQ
jgi:hypothetical protein